MANQSYFDEKLFGEWCNEIGQDPKKCSLYQEVCVAYTRWLEKRLSTASPVAPVDKPGDKDTGVAMYEILALWFIDSGISITNDKIEALVSLLVKTGCPNYKNGKCTVDW